MQRILKASAIMGISSVVTVLLSVIRYKVLALELGAEGVGALGLLVTAMTLGVTLLGLGISNSGVRQVAAVHAEGEDESAVVRGALFRTSWLLGLLSLGVGLLLTPALHGLLLPGLSWSLLVWLVVAIAASVVTGGHVALLNGVGQIPAIAKSTALGALVGTVLTVLALSVVPALGLSAALAATPLATLALTTWYVRMHRGTKPESIRTFWLSMKPMVQLGVAFSASIILANITQLLVRVLIQRDLGLPSVGYFQAAWTVSSVYLGFVLNAMAAEYYPRISAVANEQDQINQQVESQIRIVLFLASPFILLAIVASPLILPIMYDQSFMPALKTLRWQLIGDIIKVASWPIGFLLLARGAKLQFFVSELMWNAAFISGFIFLAPIFSLSATGYAYSNAYLFYFLCVLLCSKINTGFSINKNILIYILYVIVSGIFIILIPNDLHFSLQVVIGSVVIFLSFIVGLRLMRPFNSGSIYVSNKLMSRLSTFIRG